MVSGRALRLYRIGQRLDPVFGYLFFPTVGKFQTVRNPASFAKSDVLELVGSLMADANDETVRAAITAVGSNNPYLTEERAQYFQHGRSKAGDLHSMEFRVSSLRITPHFTAVRSGHWLFYLINRDAPKYRSRNIAYCHFLRSSHFTGEMDGIVCWK